MTKFHRLKKMALANYSNSIKSPELQAVIVESILIYCINESSISELVNKVQKILPLSYITIKEYLFYLINYELISYSGQSQVYKLEEGGFDLLYKIEKEKRMAKDNSEDIVIIIEPAFILK